MPLYRYKALNTRGETLDGQMEAASDGEVVLRLQEQGHLPVEARLASEGGGGGSLKALFRPKAFSGQRLVQFTQQLATLLGVQYRDAGNGMFAHSNLVTVINPDGVPTARLEGLGVKLEPAIAAIRSAGAGAN